jgi:hypothetical protein
MTMNKWIAGILGLGFQGVLFCGSVEAVPASVQERIDRDIASGKPLVIHVSVALADNEHQWIAKVPAAIGNGQKPGSNLYWGARYGLKTFLLRDGGWTKVMAVTTEDTPILERLVLRKEFILQGKTVPVYLVADAWDGRHIEATAQRFLRYSAGQDTEAIALPDGAIQAGGMAHLQVYIGHNLLMDFFASDLPAPDIAGGKSPNAAVVLACKSRMYFEGLLQAVEAHPLVLTAGLMAPEAYTLDAVITAWVEKKTDREIRQAAAAAYDRYQNTGKRAAEWLFGVKQ